MKDNKRTIEIPVFDHVIINEKPGKIDPGLDGLGADGYQIVGVTNNVLVLSKQTGLKVIDIPSDEE